MTDLCSTESSQNVLSYFSVAILAQGRANLVQDFRTWGVSLVRLCAWRRGGFCLHPQVPAFCLHLCVPIVLCAHFALLETFLLWAILHWYCPPSDIFGVTAARCFKFLDIYLLFGGTWFALPPTFEVLPACCLVDLAAKSDSADFALTHITSLAQKFR